jgi:hypothetical protein
VALEREAVEQRPSRKSCAPHKASAEAKGLLDAVISFPWEKSESVWNQESIVILGWQVSFFLSFFCLVIQSFAE